MNVEPFTEQFLVYSYGCMSCTRIANKVEEISSSWIKAMPINHPTIQRVKQLDIEVPTNEPFLLIATGENEYVVRRRFSMISLMVRKLGLRKAMAIAALLGPESPDRRGFLKGSAMAALSVAALGVGATQAQATQGDRVLAPPEAQRLFTRALQLTEQSENVEAIKGSGFDVDSAIHHGFRFSDGVDLVVTIFDSIGNPENEAAVLMCRTTLEGAQESVWGISSRQAHESARLATGTQGMSEFLACVGGLTGAGCASRLDACKAALLWPVILSCVIGACGAEAGKAAWSCKGLL